MKAIWLHTLIGRDLICMVSVRDISTAIRNLNEKDIALDFSGVEFATRSFKDGNFRISLNSPYPR